MKTLHYLIALLVVGTMACNNSTESTEGAASSDVEETTERQGQAFLTDDVGKPNALQIAIGSPDHTTLVAAVQAAKLENSLVNTGPLTVFAPTNAAFDALPDGTRRQLIEARKRRCFIQHFKVPRNSRKPYCRFSNKI